MTRYTIIKLSTIVAIVTLASLNIGAFPDYMKLFSADPLSRPEMRNKCSTCHVNPQGGGERNAFGQAFAAAGYKITDELRRQFPDRFLLPEGAQTAAPPVAFVQGSDSQAIIEVNGRKYLIDTRTRTVSEMKEGAAETAAATAPRPAPLPDVPKEEPAVYQQMDVRLINLPTAKPIPGGSMWVDFTHRFPFGDYEVTDPAGLFGLDGFAIPSFGLIYGITDRFHVGVYRSPDTVGRPIQIYAGASLLDENKGHPFTAMAHLGIEGRDNFQRNFTTSIDLTLARSVTSKAQLYLVPTISINNRPFGSFRQNLPGENTFALGVGGALNIRPTVAVMAEANMRVNEEGRFGSTRPSFGFGIEKVSVTRRHAFSLVFSNGAGTTMAQRSATRASLIGPFVDESFKGLTIGFNLSRRFF